ncbi:hypothetical protein K432DRAFT_408636 [Lepidopterella palustris CBS 459.81]|uniref:Uncharacterized protein n=1 Tax=Lepidopterella palustris CBS 459.81 TaxID=1314670 RepID=A0A8E2JAY2_9PEZI|nr:hypothetical protein K432DRAFT_408636 [Lepidopterella palustris CBS 459.81]
MAFLPSGNTVHVHPENPSRPAVWCVIAGEKVSEEEKSGSDYFAGWTMEQLALVQVLKPIAILYIPSPIRQIGDKVLPFVFGEYVGTYFIAEFKVNGELKRCLSLSSHLESMEGGSKVFEELQKWQRTIDVEELKKALPQSLLLVSGFMGVIVATFTVMGLL